MKAVVTTKHRGVFYGDTDDRSGPVVTLTDARNCVYWSAETRGVVGLAAIGPQKGSRITPAAPSITLHGVTAVMECSERAVEAWESEPWS